MTNKNGLKTYWTYIPRYEYQMWQELKQTNIRFISHINNTRQCRRRL